MSMKISTLQKNRLAYAPKLPPALLVGAGIKSRHGKKTGSVGDAKKIGDLFPNLFGQPMIEFTGEPTGKKTAIFNVGVILSGGQAPGGHNVIAGLFDGIKSINPANRLYGFKGGPGGLVDSKFIEITSQLIDEYRNTGGFDVIGSGRTKLEKVEQFEKAHITCSKLCISAIVIIGGDDSNTNACLLAEYYKKKNIPIQVIGCPKTIDGDLKNEFIETSFGFDTACKVYCELIGNIARDANSARKYWHFIRLMGRSASHITLECALQAQPNIAIIGEEVAEKKQTLMQIVDQIADVVAKRAEQGNNYGVVLVPEGLIEFIPEANKLIRELNDVMAKEEHSLGFLESDHDKLKLIRSKLGKESEKAYSSLPLQIQLQLAKDRDPHGNVQVSLIETEKLLVELVQKKLKHMKERGEYTGKFSMQTHFFGYEGRCAPPSNFDADYCYSLGFTAAALVNSGCTGYMASVRNLVKNAAEWYCGGVPLTTMMNIERRHGEEKPVIRKALVDLDSKPFKCFDEMRSEWAEGTLYVYPGPIQYFGPPDVCDRATETLYLEHS